jgi:hypothetical protein
MALRPGLWIIANITRLMNPLATVHECLVTLSGSAPAAICRSSFTAPIHTKTPMLTPGVGGGDACHIELGSRWGF